MDGTDIVQRFRAYRINRFGRTRTTDSVLVPGGPVREAAPEALVGNCPNVHGDSRMYGRFLPRPARLTE
ncbi:hypothetical protein Asi03nite_46710 [Actinoplanes siamensis]|uniref:Uncharacterized protein n=1 Tax=Actinoplanes siamensis TaxID=1223317 RepID=A0A919TMC6_9ACTN|nr:hypothetical protein Asi03nite_46710 [Actinoplanes siamensis]